MTIQLNPETQALKTSLLDLGTLCSTTGLVYATNTPISLSSNELKAFLLNAGNGVKLESSRECMVATRDLSVKTVKAD